jgi:hypothetical protein
MLSDNAGNSVIIDSTGAATCIGSCTTTTPATASPGSITWAGTVGVFTIHVAGGQSKPALPSAQINLVLRAATGALGSGAANATLTAAWGDVGFGGTWSQTHLQASFSIQGGVSVTFTGYLNNTNGLIGNNGLIGTVVGTIGPLDFSSSTAVTGPGPIREPFSMSEAVVATMGPNSSFTLAGLNLTAVPPPPLTLACASASGQVGTPYVSHLLATGGFPPYAFSIFSGSLPPGLWLNPSTGEISGTPNAPGIFSFTAQAMDASGNPSQNTVRSQCSIAITPPPAPLTLACAATDGGVGVAYSSSLVATGGVEPYTFSIASGSLPSGLVLNPATGAIVGTPTNAILFSFAPRVLDSSGNSASKSCTVTIARAARLDIVPVSNTTPQTAPVMTAFRTLAVQLTDEKGLPVKIDGEIVSFTVLGGAASGAFAGDPTRRVTDANGIATAPVLTAGDKTGSYNVRAKLESSSAAIKPTAIFKLANTAGPPANIEATSGDFQETKVNTFFKRNLTVTVTDRFGNSVPNWPVRFSVPVPPLPGATPKAGARFSVIPLDAPIGSVPVLVETIKVPTDDKGKSTSPLVMANTVAGKYDIKATVTVPDPPVGFFLSFSTKFQMTNERDDPAIMVAVIPTPLPAPNVLPTVIRAGSKFVFLAKVNQKFLPLAVRVTDRYGNEVAGEKVIFEIDRPEIGGAGAYFEGNKRKADRTTNENGMAEAVATANGVANNPKDDEYTVTVSVAGVKDVEFKLFNKR